MQTNLTAAQRATLAAEKANQKALDAKRTADMRKSATPSNPPSPVSLMQTDRVSKLKRDALPLSPRSMSHCKCPNRNNAFHECTNFCLRWNTNSIVSADIVPELQPPRPAPEESESEKKVRFSMQGSYSITYEPQHSPLAATTAAHPAHAVHHAQHGNTIPVFPQPANGGMGALTIAPPHNIVAAAEYSDYVAPVQFVQPPVQVQMAHAVHQHHSPTAAQPYPRAEVPLRGGEILQGAHLVTNAVGPPPPLLGPRAVLHPQHPIYGATASPLYSGEAPYQQRTGNEQAYQRVDAAYSRPANEPYRQGNIPVWNGVGDMTTRDSPIPNFANPQAGWNGAFVQQNQQDLGKGQCIVCGSFSDIEERRSGRKCRNCIGTSHKYKRPEVDPYSNPTVAAAALQPTIKTDNPKKAKGWRKKFLGK